jgi:hypothetical protein
MKDSNTAESGDTTNTKHERQPSDHNQFRKTDYVRNARKRPTTATIALLVLASLTAFNTITTLGAPTLQTIFPGASLFSISAQYSYGASPNGAVILPGDNVNMTLTIRDNAHTATRLAISFNATNPQDWTYLASQDLTGTCLAPIPGLYTMKIDSTNNVSPIDQTGNTCTLHQAIVTLQPGINTINGNIAVANTATIGNSFSLNWFGTPQ